MHKFLVFLVPELKKEHERIMDRKKPTPTQMEYGYSFKPTLPRVLPFIFTAYGAGNSGAIKVQPAKFIKTAMMLVERRDVQDAAGDLLISDNGCSVIPLLKHLGQVQDISQKQGIPACVLTDEHFKSAGLTGDVKKIARGQAASARKRYASLCKFLSDLPAAH